MSRSTRTSRSAPHRAARSRGAAGSPAGVGVARNILRLLAATVAAAGFATVTLASAASAGTLASAASAAPASTTAPATAPGPATTTGSAATPLLPSQDPFYTYSGTTPLADIAPGTVLKSRSVQAVVSSASNPVTAEQLLYRTTDQLGQPTVTVTTVLVPAHATATPELVGYLSFYDALGSQCDPSYTLQGGNPGAANQGLAQEEDALIGAYLGQGFIVTVPDFEGEHLAWTAGHLAGYATLDALRATESYLNLPATTMAGLSGYSGGSIAADWASELAPSYAPALNLVGVAAGGIPVDEAHNLDYINGSPVWSGIIPATLVGEARAFHVDLTPYLSAYGAQLASQVADQCISQFNGAYPGLTVQQLLKPRYQALLKQPVFAAMVNAQLMGRAPGHPTGPLFMAVGDSDGVGDGVMVTGDVEGLAHQYCRQGVPVDLAVYQGENHSQAAVSFEPAAIAFLKARFAGSPFQSSCASIPVGNALTAVPTGQGYWQAAKDGGVFSFGDAAFSGSMAGRHLNAPVVGMAVTPDGGGYWEVAADGGVFSFGDAAFYGSMAGRHLNAPVVGMAATPDGKGYWLVAQDGGVFSFGDAAFFGSMGGKPLNAPVAGLAATGDGQGYWLVGRDGGVFAFGDAGFHGSMAGVALNAPVVGLAPTAGGGGYWLAGADGGTFSFGDAAFHGSMAGTHLNAPVAAVAGDV